MRPLLSLLLGLTLLGATNLSAKLFENGEFNLGASNHSWEGNGDLVYIKPDGSLSGLPQAGATAAMELKLDPIQFRELTQRFTTPANTGSVTGQITFKVSPDFKIDAKSTAFSKDTSFTAGGHWFSVRPTFPKVDLIFCINKPEGYFYQLADVPKGGDWQTLDLSFANMGEVKAVKFCIIVPPGTGNILIKSVKINYVPKEDMGPAPGAK